MTHRGDVVIVDYPYSDRTGSKVRPAVVVQADFYNRQLADTIIALITSSKRRSVGAATQLPINVATPAGRQSGLQFNSIVQCENLVTLDQSLILKTIGRLVDPGLAGLDDRLKAALGIAG
ncbi:MAG TPA: type II toxin-antitoxin system PemK/MazF family toxin [Pirellulales bacterium]|nr:type II toxin-antitoxin system PemK/MazF family toxin [Pirellulales bacterium]